MEKFNYANKNNFLNWFGLIISGITTLLLFTFFILTGRDGDYLYEILVPIIGFAILSLIFINKMFLSKLIITENYIEYKSPFTKVKIVKEKIKGIDLLKKRRKRSPKYLTLNERPEINIGKYYIIIRKTKYKPDSAYFLSFNPVDQTYITAEYRNALFEKLKEYKYI